MQTRNLIVKPSPAQDWWEAHKPPQTTRKRNWKVPTSPIWIWIPFFQYEQGILKANGIPILLDLAFASNVRYRVFYGIFRILSEWKGWTKNYTIDSQRNLSVDFRCRQTWFEKISDIFADLVLIIVGLNSRAWTKIYYRQ